MIRSVATTVAIAALAPDARTYVIQTERPALVPLEDMFSVTREKK